MTLRFGQSVVGVSFGIDSAGNAGGPLVRVPYHCRASLSATDGVIILSIKDAQANISPEKKLMVFTPANALVQRSDSRYVVTFRDVCSGQEEPSGFSFLVVLSSEAKHLSNMLDSAAANWPVQASVISANERYRCKVESLLRNARPSRCRSNGATPRKFPVATALRGGRNAPMFQGNKAVSEASTDATPLNVGGQAAGTAPGRPRGRQPARNADVSVTTTVTPRRCVSAPHSARTHLLAVSNEERTRLQARTVFLLQSAMGVHPSATAPIAPLANSWRLPADRFPDAEGAVSASARLAFTEQATSVVQVYLPHLLPWIKRYELLSAHLIPVGQDACAPILSITAAPEPLLRAEHTPAPLRSERGTVMAARTKEQRLDKELVLVISALCEAASCTMTSRNGLSRRQFKKLVHLFRDRALGERKHKGGAAQREQLMQGKGTAPIHVQTVQPSTTRVWPKDGPSGSPATARRGGARGVVAPGGQSSTARLARPARAFNDGRGQRHSTTTPNASSSSPPFGPALQDDSISSSEVGNSPVMPASGPASVPRAKGGSQYSSQTYLRNGGTTHSSHNTVHTSASAAEPSMAQGSALGAFKQSFRSTISGHSAGTDSTQANSEPVAPGPGSARSQYMYEPAQAAYAPSESVNQPAYMPGQAFSGPYVPQRFAPGMQGQGQMSAQQAMMHGNVAHGQPHWQYAYNGMGGPAMHAMMGSMSSPMSAQQSMPMPVHPLMYSPGPVARATVHMTPQGPVMVPNGYMGYY